MALLEASPCVRECGGVSRQTEGREVQREGDVHGGVRRARRDDGARADRRRESSSVEREASEEDDAKHNFRFSSMRQQGQSEVAIKK